jgi:hypothetical protein
MPAAIEKDDDPTIPFYPLLEEDGFSPSSGKALAGEAVKIRAWHLSSKFNGGRIQRIDG